MEVVVKKRGRGRPSKAPLGEVPGLEPGTNLKEVKLNGFGVSEISKAQFKGYDLDGAWSLSLGKFVGKGFSALIWGKPKSGKSHHVNALAKYLTRFVKRGGGVVYYNSAEQGKVPTVQGMVLRQGFEGYEGLITWGNRETWAQLLARLEGRNPPPFVFIDSIDKMGLTKAQIDWLLRRYPTTHFYFITQCYGKQPAQKWVGTYLRHEVDATCYVEDFIAHWESRYEGGEPYVIWREGAMRRGALKVEAGHEVVVNDKPLAAILDEDDAGQAPATGVDTN